MYTLQIMLTFCAYSNNIGNKYIDIKEIIALLKQFCEVNAMDQDTNYFQLNFKFILMWIILLVVGFIYLITGIAHETLWYDESYSAAIITHSIQDIWRIAGSDSHPPLYFIVLKAISSIFGRTEFGLRIFSVFGVLALSALGIGPVRRIFGKGTGLIYSFIILILPVSLFMGQEARMYTWAAFCVTGCALYGYLAASLKKKYDWPMFGIFTVLAAYTHYYALLAAIITNILIFLWIFFKDRQQLKKYVITSCVSLAIYLPWVFVLAGQISRVSKDFWISPVTGTTIFNTLLYPFTLKFPPLPPLIYYAMPAFIITAFFVVKGFISIIKSGFSTGNAAAFALSVYLLTLLAGIIFSLLIRPVFIERYSVPVIGLLIVSAAFGITQFKSSGRMILACLLLLFSVSPFIVHINQYRLNGPLAEIKSFMKENIKQDDIFIHTDEHTNGLFTYYFPSHKQFLYQEPGYAPYSGMEAFSPDGSTGRDLTTFMKGHKNIWLVTRIGSPGLSAVNDLLSSGKLNVVGKVERFFITSSQYAFTLRRVEPGENKPKASVNKGTLKIKFDYLKDKPGPIYVYIFNKEGYMSNYKGIVNENVLLKKSFSYTQAKAGVIIDNLPYGNYAVGVLHDQDENGNLSLKNGYPTEGYGMTNTINGIKLWATFEACMFEMDTNEKSVEVEMYYPRM